MPLDVPRMLACCAAFGDVDEAQKRKLSLEALSQRLQSRDRMRSAHTLIDTKHKLLPLHTRAFTVCMHVCASMYF